MNRRSPVTICLWCLLANGELLYLHGRLSRFVNNQSKSRLLANLLNLKNLVDIGGVSFQVTISTGNLTDIVGGELTISGSRKVRAIFINFPNTFIFQKYTAHVLRWFLFRIRSKRFGCFRFSKIYGLMEIYRKYKISWTAL